MQWRKQHLLQKSRSKKASNTAMATTKLPAKSTTVATNTKVAKVSPAATTGSKLKRMARPIKDMPPINT